MIHDAHQLAAEIRHRARTLGFDRVGIAIAEPSRHTRFLRQWLEDGRAGTMEFLERTLEQRIDPSAYLPGARSVLCFATNYHVPLQQIPPDEHAYQGRIARYALGQDYHEPLKKRLWQIADWLRETVPGSLTRTCVDTAPVLEREFAARTGIGWAGKNTCVINEQIGSWLLLGEIITTLELPADEPAIDRCGTCTRCIDACPTQAITDEYQLDPRRCISYLNIEHEGQIPPEFQHQLNGWLFGCDICQDVCPWNNDAPTAIDPLFQPRFATGSIDLREVLAWSEPEYRTRLRKSPMRRLKLPVLQRNARHILDAASERQT